MELQFQVQQAYNVARRSFIVTDVSMSCDDRVPDNRVSTSASQSVTACEAVFTVHIDEGQKVDWPDWTKEEQYRECKAVLQSADDTADSEHGASYTVSSADAQAGQLTVQLFSRNRCEHLRAAAAGGQLSVLLPVTQHDHRCCRYKATNRQVCMPIGVPDEYKHLNIDDLLFALEAGALT